MAMVFCTGCGKEIHETAPMCPHCGFRFGDSSLASPRSVSIWMAVVSSAFAFLNFLNWFKIDKWNDKDLLNGMWVATIVSLILSSISLAQKRKGKVLNIISLVVTGMTAIMLIGRQ
jgi:predicted amidophosphoribosyltransferase